MANDTRKATNHLLEMIEEGAISKDAVITACMTYMSEADVADMCHANEFFDVDEDEDETEEEET